MRARYPALPFVGTVPAIKPAAAASKSRLISVLATTGTVARDYTQALVREYAGDCEVALVGSPHLARLAEDCMKGLPVDDAEIAREIAPCFVESGGRRTDFVVLACTHYPLLQDQFVAPCALAGGLYRSGSGDRAPRRRSAWVRSERTTSVRRRFCAGHFHERRAPGAGLQKALRKFGLVRGADRCGPAFEFTEA